MYGLSAMASAGRGRLSRVVWKSAILFCVRSRMRFNPRMGYSFLDGGRTELLIACFSWPWKTERNHTCNLCRTFVAERNIDRRRVHPVS